MIGPMLVQKIKNKRKRKKTLWRGACRLFEFSLNGIFGVFQVGANAKRTPWTAHHVTLVYALFSRASQINWKV